MPAPQTRFSVVPIKGTAVTTRGAPRRKDGEYISVKYKPEYCNLIRDLAQDGKFPETWCATIGVTVQTLYNWSNRYPEFEEAMHIAHHLLQHAWTEKAAGVVNNSHHKGQAVLVEILRKRFPKVYGAAPQLTYENFTQRNLKETEDDPSSADNPEGNESLEVLNSEIDDLLAMRAALNEEPGDQ